MPEPSSDHDRLLSELVGRTCQHCGEGELEIGEHRGSPAVVCSACDVPQVSFA